MLVRQPRPGCVAWLATLIASGFAVFLTAQLLPGVEIDSIFSAIWAAFVLGLLNAMVRPVLVALTLPVTVLTLGLFLLVVNGTMIGLAAWLLEGFRVDGIGWGVLAAIVLSVVSTLFSRLLGAPGQRGGTAGRG